MHIEFPLTVSLDGIPDVFEREAIHAQLREGLRQALTHNVVLDETHGEPRILCPNDVIGELFGPLVMYAASMVALSILEDESAQNAERRRVMESFLNFEVRIKIEKPELLN